MTALVTQREWASQLGVSVWTFRRWRNDGRIPMPLTLPGWPRWSGETVERVTRELQHAGETRFFRKAQRQKRSLQSHASRFQQGSRALHGAGVSGELVSERHAESVGDEAKQTVVQTMDGAR